MAVGRQSKRKGYLLHVRKKENYKVIKKTYLYTGTRCRLGFCHTRNPNCNLNQIIFLFSSGFVPVPVILFTRKQFQVRYGTGTCFRQSEQPGHKRKRSRCGAYRNLKVKYRSFSTYCTYITIPIFFYEKMLVTPSLSIPVPY